MTSPAPIPPRELPEAIRGLFAYLDVTLPEEIKADAGKPAFTLSERHRDFGRSRVRIEIGERIGHSFRLQHWGSPLSDALTPYRIYHREDMADALSVAYCLHKRGGSPLQAFTADYALWWGGILSWVDIGAFRQAERDGGGPRIWDYFGVYCRAGDRFLRYGMPSSIGYMLVRGDRLLWERELLHICVPDGDPRWEADYAEFTRLGGCAGFLAGKFTWPPVGWVNPMTSEAVAAELRRRRGTDEIDPGSPAALSFRDATPGEVRAGDEQLLKNVGALLGTQLKPMVLE